MASNAPRVGPNASPIPVQIASPSRVGRASIDSHDSQSQIDASSSSQELLYKIVTTLETQLSELNRKLDTNNATLNTKLDLLDTILRTVDSSLRDINITAEGGYAIGGAGGAGGAGGNATARAIASALAIANAPGRERWQRYEGLPQRLEDIEKHLKHIEKRIRYLDARYCCCAIM